MKHLTAPSRYLRYNEHINHYEGRDTVFMGRSFNKLWRNRVTLLALPCGVVAVSLFLFAGLVLQLDFYLVMTLAFVAVISFCCALFFWRIKSPLSFWSVYIFTEPSNARFYNNRAAVYLGRGDYEHALHDYNMGIQLEPKAETLALLYSGRVALFSHMGRYKEALEDAEHGSQYMSTKLSSVALLYNRGYAYQRLFAYDAALHDYEQVISANQSITPGYVHLSRGLIYASLGNYQGALQEEDASVQKLPYTPGSYHSRAVVHLKFLQYQRALEDTNRALELCRPTTHMLTRRGGDYPYAASVYAQRALAYCGLQDYQRALEDARKGVELAPVFGPNFYSLGQVYLATDDIVQARQSFQQGFEADPKDVSNAALFAWTTMCSTLPNVEQAAFLSEAANNYPESEWASLCQGMAAWLRKDYPHAQISLARSQQLDMANPHCYFWLGMLHASQGEDDLALSAFQQAVQSGLAHALLMPLRYFEQKRPDFYRSLLLPLLAK